MFLLLIGVGIVMGREWLSAPRHPRPSAPPADVQPSDVEATTPDPGSTAPAAVHEFARIDRCIAFAATGAIASLIGRGIPALSLAAIPFVAAPMVPLTHQAVEDLRTRRKLGLGTLQTLAALTVFAAGKVTLVGIALTMFFTGQRMLRMTRHQAKASLISAFGEWDERAWLWVDGVEIETPVEKIRAGDLLVVHTGGPIPVDGEVVDGVLTIDERMLTGESMLAERIAGDTVHAATLVVRGSGRIRARHAGSETKAARLQALLAKTDSYEQAIELRSETAADDTVVPTLALGAVGLGTRGASAFVGCIWANCMDLSWLASPAAVLQSIRMASDRGILIKDGRSLDLLAQIDTMVFDKTGTLTMNSFQVGTVHTSSGVQADELLALAAAAERGHEHPIARALRAAASEQSLEFDVLTIEDAAYQAGRGLEAVVDGRMVLLGSRRLLHERNVALPESAIELTQECESWGHSVVHVALSGEYAGSIELEPQARPEARRVIEHLRERGIRSIILTGDGPGPTRRLAETLGIDTWYAGTLPDEKQARIASLCAEGRKVCYVGDGINDTLAMRRAHVSISMTGSSAIALDCAQIILRDGSLDQLGAVLDLGKQHQVVQTRITTLCLVPTVIAMGGVLLVGVPLSAINGLYVATALAASGVVAMHGEALAKSRLDMGMDSQQPAAPATGAQGLTPMY
jgi:heavy metal translocating P-type ATPase